MIAAGSAAAEFLAGFGGAAIFGARDTLAVAGCAATVDAAGVSGRTVLTFSRSADTIEHTTATFALARREAAAVVGSGRAHLSAERAATFALAARRSLTVVGLRRDAGFALRGAGATLTTIGFTLPRVVLFAAEKREAHAGGESELDTEDQCYGT